MLSLNLANASLSQITTAEELRALLKDIDISSPGSTTVLYSGFVNGVHSSVVIDELKSNKDIRLIDKTVAAKFLSENEELKDALFRIFQSDPDEIGSPANQFLYGQQIDGVRQPNGAWDIISKRFAEEASGDVRLLADMNADPRRVFGATELTALLNNPNVTSIEGIPKSELTNKSLSAAFEHVRNIAWKNAVGTGLSATQMSNWLNITEETFSHPDYINNIKNQLNTLNAGEISSLKNTTRFLSETGSKIVKHLPVAGKLLLATAIAMTAAEASAAAERGDQEEARSIWLEFALKEAGSEVAGAIIGAIAAGVAASVGAPAAVVTAVAIGAMIVGGYVTEETIAEHAQLIRDHDKNGTMDFLDRLSNLFFGTNDQLSDTLPAGYNPDDKFVIDVNCGAEKLFAMAKNNLAYRYAIINLNPFVITNYDYSRFSSNPKYNYDNYSEQYWKDRAEMTWWNTQFYLQGNDVGRDLNTDMIEGNVDFVDLNTPIAGSDSLQLSIDGKGISEFDHKIIFGSDNADTLLGSGDSDRLYGAAGDDILVGGEGEDYLEGGEGDDILYGGNKDNTSDGEADILYGGNGFNRYFVDEYDTIYIDDDQGLYGAVFLNNVELTEAVAEKSSPDTYTDDYGNTYTFEEDTLIINGGLRIENFKKFANTTTDQNGDNIYSALGITIKQSTQDDEQPDKSGAERKISPIVIDLNNNGIETTLKENVHFDHAGDALKELTGWVAPEDGLLVRDLNGDGIINNGSELFGNNTLLRNGQRADNGYQALAELDENGDGVIDIQDSHYSSLQIWRDANSNGLTESGELIDLAEAGITAIGTVYTESDYVDCNGNSHKQTGNVLLADGSEVASADVWFAVDERDRIHTHDIPLTEDVVRLPDARGFGKVMDLRQAIARDDELKALLTRYISEQNTDTRDRLLDQLIYRWAGVQDVKLEEIYHINSLQLAVIEQLTGSKYENVWQGSNVLSDASGQLLNEYLRFKNYTEAQILIQTEFYDDFKDIILTSFNSGVSRVVIKIDEATSLLRHLFQTAQHEKISAFSNILNYSEDRQSLFNTLILQDPDIASYVVEYAKNSTRDNDSLVGGKNSDILGGREGADTLNGDEGNDILVGGKGNDYLVGGRGSDTYIYQRGDGHDTINNYSHLKEYKLDILKFMSGISPSDIIVSSSDQNLVLTLSDGSGSITIPGHFLDRQHCIDEIHFSDGTIWSTDIILGLMQQGDDNSQALYADTAGSQLKGFGGNDYLYGDAGDDILIGGTGNDRLEGGDGSDTYFFARGDGRDTIFNYDNNYRNITDTLQFAQGISPDDIIVSRTYGSLILSIRNSLDQITINNHFGYESAELDRVCFADGTVWDKAMLRALTQVGNELGQNLYAEGLQDSEIHAGGGNDSVFGSMGNDMLYGDDGDDYIDGGSGNDTLAGGKGNDYLNGNDGSDTYIFNSGDGHDVINDYSSSYGDDRNILRFGEGIRAEEIAISVIDYCLVLSLNNGHDSVTLQDILDQVQFSDGTVWDRDELNRLLSTGLENIDSGETDNDKIINENISDTYIFEQGDGQCIIHNQPGSDAIATLKFGEGIFSHDIKIVFNQKNDLILQTTNTSDSVTIANFFKSAASRIDRIEFSDGTVWLAEDIITAAQQGNDSDQILYASPAVSTLYAGAGDDSLKGSHSDDTLYGEEGDDRLYGREGNDILRGGQGNDYLSGGYGSDIYLFSRGDGQDIIDNRQKFYGDTACLRFDATIVAEDILLSVKDGALVLRIRNTSDQITILDYFNDKNDYSNTIEFANGERWQRENIIPLLSISGGSEADEIYARENGSEIHAGAGDDYLYGSVESDALLGEAGDDMLSGREGDDYLEGGGGNDTLSGGHGSDTYIFNQGDGHDIIDNRVESWYEYDDADTLNFGKGINPDTLTLSVNNGDLVLSLPNGSDSVTIKGYFTHGYYSDMIYMEGEKILTVESIKFDNGHIWSYNKVREMLMKGDNTDQELYALPAGDEFFAGGGDDQLYGHTGNDLLFGEADSDRLYGREGDDILAGGAGNDVLEGGMGADTYIFNRGDGQDIINDRQRFFSSDYAYFSDDEENTPQVRFDYRQYDKYLEYTEDDRYPDTNRDDGYESDAHLEESRYINDTLRFGETINSNDVDISASGNDLILSIRGSTDSITLQNYLTKESVYLIEQIVFADRTVWTPEYIFNVLENAATATQSPSLQLMRQSVSQFMGGDDDDGTEGVNMTSPLLSASTTSGWSHSARF